MRIYVGFDDTDLSHIERNFIEESDPGLCSVREDDPVLPALISFGLGFPGRLASNLTGSLFVLQSLLKGGLLG